MEIPKIITLEPEPEKMDEAARKKHLRVLALLLFVVVGIICGLILFKIVLPGLRPPVVKTSFGIVKGTTWMRAGKPVSVFLGVPFAKAPVGKLRFKKPVNSQPWAPEVLNAVKQPPACVQFLPPKMIKSWKPITQSEDCLYLNIYVPGKPDSKNRLPVIVWIHGGAFYFGSIAQYDPSPLAATGKVIVVSIAYRLGIFGFLSSNNKEEAPGNVGLHDQVMAIKWIRKHIGSFGGDPYEITLMGESAGAISVGYHMLSPLSRRLFKRAILQSGSALTPTMMVGHENGPIYLEKVADALDCSYLSRRNNKYATFNEETFMCIRNASTFQLLQVQTQIATSRRSTGFHPTVDGDFFPEHPYRLTHSSAYGPQHEILLGTTANEGAMFMTFGLPNLFPAHTELPKNLTQEMIMEKLSQKAPEDFQENSKTYLKYMFDFMLGGIPTGNGTIIASRMDRVLGNSMFLCPNIALVDTFTKISGREAFYYQFNPRPANAKHFPWVKGALHAEEIQFVFGGPLIEPSQYTKAEIQLSRDIMADWSTFARYGKPVHSRKWEPCKNNLRYHLVYDIDVETMKPTHTVKIGLPDNRCDLYFDTFYEQMVNDYGYFVLPDRKRKRRSNFELRSANEMGSSSDFRFRSGFRSRDDKGRINVMKTRHHRLP